MSNLTTMPNIAKTLESKLETIGITSSEELKAVGSKEAFLRLKNEDDSVCINMLYALEGAIQGIRWHNLEDGMKKDLKEFYNGLK